MALEVQFSGLVPATRTINLTSEDLVALHKVVVDYFLTILPHTELSERTCQWDPSRAAIADFAVKFGIDPLHTHSLVNFYEAVLKHESNG